MRRDPEKTYEKILEVSSKLFFEKGYENTSLQDIVNNLDGLTKGAVYHHFSSKDDILDAIEDKLLVENNPFKKVLVYSELTGIELIKKAFLLGIEDQEQQYYNKISMRIWRQSEKIQSPKMIAKMIEINKNIKIAFISGFIFNEEELKNKFKDNLIGLIRKPYTKDDLIKV